MALLVINTKRVVPQLTRQESREIVIQGKQAMSAVCKSNFSFSFRRKVIRVNIPNHTIEHGIPFHKNLIKQKN